MQRHGKFVRFFSGPFSFSGELLVARYEVVLATRVPAAVERGLRRRANGDDRSLSAHLRRQLVAMTSGPAAKAESDTEQHAATEGDA
jgi:hypothetical protein